MHPFSWKPFDKFSIGLLWDNHDPHPRPYKHTKNCLHMALTFCMDITLSMVRTPENVVIIQWEEHKDKGVTDGWTDRQKEVVTYLSPLRIYTEKSVF